MVFNRADLFRDELFKSNILYVSSRYNLFINIIVDRFKDKFCRVEIDDSTDPLLEFTGGNAKNRTSTEKSATGKTIVKVQADNLNDFMELNKIPSMVGKRLCICEYNSLTVKQKEWLTKYKKKPSKEAVIVFIVREFKDSTKLEKSLEVKTTDNVNYINLSFPRQDTLKEIIKNALKEKKIENDALSLFTLRLGKQYDQYPEAFECVRMLSVNTVKYKDMMSALADIDNYSIDDFLEMLLKPNRNLDKKPRKIYKALSSMLNEYSAKKIVTNLMRKIDILIEMREALNNGIVPAGIQFSIKDVKAKLPDESKIKDLSDFAFVKQSKLAMMTSLRDLMSMKLIMYNNRLFAYNEIQYERMLLTLINRAILCDDRVANDIGMKEMQDELLYDVNTVGIV